MSALAVAALVAFFVGLGLALAWAGVAAWMDEPEPGPMTWALSLLLVVYGALSIGLGVTCFALAVFP